MTWTRRLAPLLLCLMLAAACGSGESTTSELGASAAPSASDAAAAVESSAGASQAAPAETTGELDRAALIIAQGGLGDESYNDLANAGFERALQATGVEGTPVESEDIVAQGEQVLRRAGESGFGLIITLEFTHGEILGRIAQDFPDTHWAILNTVVEAPNVVSVLFAEHEGSYLAGALAAMMTTVDDNPRINPDKVIGVIGGTQSTGIDKFIVGYIQGATDVDPEVEVLTSYTNDFADPAAGQQQARAMFEQGADIVYHVAGGTGAGVIQAADESERYAIGVDTDQDDLAPGSVLTSMIKRADVAVEELVTRAAAGELEGGTTLNFGLEENGVGLSDFTHTRDAIPDEFIERLDELRSQIIAGDIEVWNVIEQGYPDFYQP